LRPEFERAGARLAVVSSIDTGAQEFTDAVWPDGEIYIDEEETFKKALGGQIYRTFWLLRPVVLRNLASVLRKHGTATADVTDKKTQLLGGTFVVKQGEVVYTHRETATFDNGDAREVLAAVLGKDVSELSLEVPKQEQVVCTRDARV